MDSNPATEPETPPPPDEPWRRFTLLDLLILFSGHEAALGLMKWYGAFEDVQWSDISIVAYLLVFILLGSIISVPPIIFIQFHSRGRCDDLADGEIFSVFSVIYWSYVFIGFLFDPRDVFYGFGTICFAIFWFIGIVLLILNLLKKSKSSPCPWLSVYGYSLFFIPASLFVLRVLL
jgi:hypothetical protein